VELQARNDRSASLAQQANTKQPSQHTHARAHPLARSRRAPHLELSTRTAAVSGRGGRRATVRPVDPHGTVPVRAGLWLSPPHAVNNRKLTLEPVSPKIAAAAFAVWRRLRARSEPRLSSSRGACEQRWRRACHSLVITRPPRRRWMGARAVARASSGVARGAYRGRRPVAGRQSAAGGAPGAVHCRRDVPDPTNEKAGTQTNTNAELPWVRAWDH